MNFSKYAIEQMGYAEYQQSDTLEIHFGLILAYSLRGIVFDKDCQLKQSNVVNFGENCKAVISESVNEAAKLLINDTFTDDEEKWISEKKVTSPFLLIHFKESAAKLLKGGYRQEKDGYILTYDAFPEGKIEIRNWEKEILPSVITSLTVNLSTLDRQVELIPIERSIFGLTNDGKTVFDMKFSGSANAYVSKSKKPEEIDSLLDKSQKLFSTITKDMCSHFYTALNETDRLKKYLGYFFFIERLTHSTYKTLSFSDNAIGAFNIPTRLDSSMKVFFENVFTDSKNLSQRFHWCAMFAWDSIDEIDVASFLELKKVRDKLSHGEHIEESALPVEKAKTLAMKLLGAK